MSQAAAVVYRYFPDLTDAQKDQLAQLQELYETWNARINVISRKDMEALYVHHVLHSLAIARFVQFAPASRILDVGTGGGFPGIPLAILFPESDLLLVDSIGKKIKVVQEVAAAIGLQNVTARHERAEKIKQKVDFVVSRAVAPTLTVYQWVHHLIKPSPAAGVGSGILLLKGGDLAEELKTFGRSHSVVSLTDYFDEPFFETKKLVYIPV